MNILSYLFLYCYVGIKVYIFCAIMNWRSFKGINAKAIIKGILYGIFLWPVVLPLFLYLYNKHFWKRLKK